MLKLVQCKSNGPFAAGTKLESKCPSASSAHQFGNFVQCDRPAAKGPLPWQKEVSMATLKGATTKGTVIPIQAVKDLLTRYLPKLEGWERENLIIKFAKWPHFRPANKQRQGNLKELPPMPSKHKGRLLKSIVSIILI